MSFDSDIALIGTGVAPLIAASHLAVQGKSVLVINPDLDFFLEDSELPLDPLLRDRLSPELLSRNLPESVLNVLRPDYPGAIEFWAAHSQEGGFHDATAPHVRQRGRLWISSPETTPLWNWDDLESLFVEASDAGLSPQLLDGISAAKRFPGFSGPASPDTLRGLFIPKLCDVDVVRYRNGLLEYVRERLGHQRVLCAVTQLDPMPGGIRFHLDGNPYTARIHEGILAFWTPRLTSWVQNQRKNQDDPHQKPKGVRLWEQWSLVSRDALDPHHVGMFGDMAVWAEFEGPPQKERPTTTHLGVLRAGNLAAVGQPNLPNLGLNWASSDSFGALWNLCHGFLKWEHFSVRNLRVRAIFEWDERSMWFSAESDPRIQIIPKCDGPLVEVVKSARSACDRILEVIT